MTALCATTASSLVIISAIVSVVACPTHVQGADSMTIQAVSESMATDQSYYSRYWPQGHAALFKLKDNLILAVPPQYQKFWLQKDQVIREPTPLSQLPQVNAVAFDFFLPECSGYTPQNYLSTFDSEKVEVVELGPADPKQTEPDAPGSYPPNMLKRALHAYLHKNQYQDQYGLRCYRGDAPKGLERTTCYGRRDYTAKEDIMLYATVAPAGPANRFPTMQAEYFTRRYGGLRIVWRTHARNLPRWHDIDAQIWKFVDAWKISDPSDVILDPKKQ